MVTSQEGQGLAEELIKVAGPLIVQQAQAGLQDIQRGKSAADTWADRSVQLSRGLKRKAPAMVWAGGKHKAKKTYKRATPCLFNCPLSLRAVINVDDAVHDNIIGAHTIWLDFNNYI